MKEYKIYPIKYDAKLTEQKLLESEMNHIADDGWELKTNFWIDYLYGRKYNLVLIFEREKQS